MLSRNLPDGIAPSCGWPAGSYAAKLCVGVGLQLADDLNDVGVIGIVQHKVTTCLDFRQGVLDALGPNATVHQDQIEGVIGMDVDSPNILIEVRAWIVVVVDEAGTL